MGRADPFYGYSILLRSIVYGAVPAYLVFQYFRVRRALHVFQLEGYKRERFLQWCRQNRARALFLTKRTQKKPLVMTGRAWRIAVTGLVLTTIAVLVVPGIVHVSAGWPWDVAAWALLTVLTFVLLPQTLIAADWLLVPVQGAINARYLRGARRRLDDYAPTVIGVTGSFGKTSTKFAIAGLVGPSGSALATPGSFNTPLGVCRTINESLRPEHRFFVVEMGAYGEGEIADLCRFARPTIGVLTAVGPAHLERFGSMEAIRRAKYEIVRDLPSEGAAVMNVDDPVVRELADATTHVFVRRYGIDPAGRPDITARNVSFTSRGTSFVISDGRDEIDADMRLLGRHSVGHVLAGVAVAELCGRALPDLRGPIARLEPVEHRLQLIEGTGGVTVIDDAYNSNPGGALAALDVLADIPGERKVVVTPGMVELGPLQQEENLRFARRAGEVADVVIAVARANRAALVEGAGEGNARVVAVDSLDEARRELEKLLRGGDIVLFENDLPDQYEG